MCNNLQFLIARLVATTLIPTFCKTFSRLYAQRRVCLLFYFHAAIKFKLIDLSQIESRIFLNIAGQYNRNLPPLSLFIVVVT